MDATLIAAICLQYGKRVGGRYEIFIPNSTVGSLSRTRQVQQVNDPQGLKFVYDPNNIIEGTVVKPPVVETGLVKYEDKSDD